jgi:hypothetical protein
MKTQAFARPGALILLAVAHLTALTPTAASAQEARAATFIAIAETFPPIDARAIVLREGGRDVVLLRSDDATPETLAMALIALGQAREREPSPALGEMLPLMGYTIERPMGEGYRRRLEAALASLVRQPVTEIGSFGPGRWLRYRGR